MGRFVAHNRFIITRGINRLKKKLQALSGSLVSLGRSQKRMLQIVADFAGVAVSVVVVSWFELRLGMLFSIASSVALATMAVWIMRLRGVYRAWVRYLAPQTGFVVFVVACTVTVFAAMGHRIALGGWPDVGVAFDLLTLLFFALIGPRLATRALFLWAGDQRKENVAIYGAGAAGRELAAALRAGSAFNPALFIDDEKSLQSTTVMNVPVRGFDYLSVALENGVTRVLLAMPRLSISRRRQIVERLGEYKVSVQTVPSFPDLVQGQAAVDQLRDLSALDLLGRDPVPADRQLIEHDVRNRVVLITGAGGSIGSELARQVQAQQAARLILLDHSEIALYEIERELQNAPVASPTKVEAILGSVTNTNQIRSLLARFDVETVYHAAAYKHVPIIEENICAGVHNNLVGTWILGTVAAEMGVESFVLVSTDKAVRPTNIMGATKRAAEMAVQALAKVHSRTRFSIVRFGNVLDSSGSVVPLFRKQIAKGGPVTVTHREIIRYFMTIPEAAQLVIQAGAMGRDAEVFVLDMGQPVRIYDLALRMVRLAGYEPIDRDGDGDIQMEIIGLRPGEKLYEELLVQGDEQSTKHPRIFRADEPSLSLAEFSERLEKVQKSLNESDAEAVRDALLQFPVEFQQPRPTAVRLA